MLGIFKAEIANFLNSEGIILHRKKAEELGRQTKNKEQQLSQDRMAEYTRWADWPNSAPMP